MNKFYHACYSIAKLRAVFLLVTAINHANAGELISAEWLSTNGATGDRRIDKWNVTVSFGPGDVAEKYKAWGG